MKRKLKGNPPKFIFMLFVTAFAAFSCEHKNTVEANKDAEIIWQQTTLDSLSVQSLATHPNGSIFAASCCRGIFGSIDRGTTWTPVSKNYVNVLSVHPNGSIFAVYSNFVFRSMDNGERWELLRARFGTDGLRAIAFNPNGEIFIGGAMHDVSGHDGGIYHSVDGGIPS